MFEKAVRKIGPNNRSITGKQISRKSPDSQHFESSLERDYLLLLEYDEVVLRFTAQPVTITYYINEQRRRYTPDVAVYFHPSIHRKPWLVEIKYQADLIAHKAELEPKFAAARDYCRQCGYEFIIMTEAQIRTDKLHNIRFLSRYKGQKHEPTLRQAILTSLNNQAQLTARQLLSNAPTDIAGQLLYALWQLVADKELLVDMNNKIIMDTLIWKKQ
ncbi:TnsA endonuclease-like protein [Mucilaginibacter gracilis]|uniref:TnsA endonuclease-like protein n=1 Tax=Mucilaginibacter gracilis TaxID=423350 RepID=A0A495J016_9SPHI|nr:TnsA endonuclease N-terminal domain-containing protein [Mucilaginibacter gracilis]RKR82072.1 TnsA endonuclease-like protein [Mucilaginibacter gracilis]